MAVGLSRPVVGEAYEQGGPDITGFEYLQPVPANLKGLKPEEVTAIRKQGAVRSARLAMARACAAKLPQGQTARSFPEIAMCHTLGRRPDMTPVELGIWEALRDPVTGVPPRDVRGTIDAFDIGN